MKHLLTVIGAGFRAETHQLRRSPLLLALTFVQAVTFLVLVSLFGLTGSNVPTAVVDQDGGPQAQQWIADMKAAHHTYSVRSMAQQEAERALAHGDVAAVITIPKGFSDDIRNHRMTRLPVKVDNVNADLTDDVERGFPSTAVVFAKQQDLPGIRVSPAETDLIDHDTDFIPYLVVSALALDALLVAGMLGASAVAREFEARTVAGLALAPVSPLVPLSGPLLATSCVSAGALSLTPLLVVILYGVVPVHALELVLALLACVLIFSFVGAAVGAVLRRTLPVAALLFGLALPLFIDSGSIEPLRFDGTPLWLIGHTSPVYYAVGVLQHAAHDLQVTPEPVAVDFAALVAWALLAALLAGAALRRGVRP